MPPMPPPDPNQQPAQPDSGVTFTTFSGLKNTVSPESLTARQLSRAQNVDLDDLGQLHRRRGRRQVATGLWHSIVSTRAPSLTFGSHNGDIVLVNRDYTTTVLRSGAGVTPLAWVQVGPTLYFNSSSASGQIDLATLAVSPWAGSHVADFWLSPVVRPEPTLGAVAGKLLGSPPLGTVMTHHNGRIYIGAGKVLWATELFLYNYVDKTKGFRPFESAITGLMSVEDGVYVGTEEALYFLSGSFNEHVRTVREKSGVVPGSMVQAPGELVDPEGRRFPDLPRPTSKAMICMTAEGVVAGLPGGQTFNLTRTEFVFPRAVRAAAMLRQEDGVNTLVMPLASGGAPNDNARFGDYLSAQVIRAGSPGQPGAIPPVSPQPPKLIA